MRPSPCPCCGNTDLYTGHLSASRMGVQCLPKDDVAIRQLTQLLRKIKPDQIPEGCGLSLGVEISDYPDDFPEELTGRAAVQKLEQLTLEEAIRRWNRRTLEPKNATA